jgi:adenylate kinase family enzyme
VDRIAIIGCGGSGKSHLARELGTTLGITPVHLDALYYDKDWKPLDQESFASLQRDLVASPRWIIDGNYASTLPIRLEAADTVIFLDIPGWACLWGILQRRLRHGGGQHQAIGVYDRITWNFVRYIIGYHRQMAARVRTLIADDAGHAEVIVLRSRPAARRYLGTATASAVAAGLTAASQRKNGRKTPETRKNKPGKRENSTCTTAGSRSCRSANSGGKPTNGGRASGPIRPQDRCRQHHRVLLPPARLHLSPVGSCPFSRREHPIHSGAETVAAQRVPWQPAAAIRSGLRVALRRTLGRDAAAQ